MTMFFRILGLFLACMTIAACTPVALNPVVDQQSNTPVVTNLPRARLFLMGDNQERLLFGSNTWYSGTIAHELSKVAKRSLEQDMYGKFLVQNVLEDIAKTTPPGATPATVLHLGDALDLGCLWEWENLQRVGWVNAPNLYVAPGNHDVIFGGNASYLGAIGKFWLKNVRGLVEEDLSAHHNWVCSRGLTGKSMPPSIERRMEEIRASNPKLAGYPARAGDDTVRQLPNRFRCDYLRLKTDLESQEAAEVKRYCDEVTVGARYTNPSPTALKPTTVEMKRGTVKGRASLRGGSSYNDWSPGHLVQHLRVPLQLPIGAGTAGDVVVILLDTTDWAQVPSWGFWLASDSARGSVGPEQRRVVEDWLKEAASDDTVKGVVFSGHYPLKDLSRQTLSWLHKVFDSPKALPLYFSAHTHTGYSVERGILGYGSRAREINVGSLADNTVHYRSVDIRWDEQSREFLVSSSLVNPSVNCSPDALDQGRKNAQSYLQDSYAPTMSSRGEWCTRLMYASRLLAPYSQEKIEIDDVVCQDTRRGLQKVVDAEERMIDVLSKSTPDERWLKACQAIGGAEAFRFDHFNSKPPQLVTFKFKSVGSAWEAVANN